MGGEQGRKGPEGVCEMGTLMGRAGREDPMRGEGAEQVWGVLTPL